MVLTIYRLTPQEYDAGTVKLKHLAEKTEEVLQLTELAGELTARIAAAGSRSIIAAGPAGATGSAS